ncbi:hypothetical protein OCK74_10605 [Chitinophagaceae bacterium LB-8]|uniref:Copper-binding protein MbnP-like domain-containing protein n=1 Tax=Paraflavisolibacter caeni TaxID=2982496 RepID=A0A9X2XVV6_9BACT|nr:MbnP family protein [Paraflavisolibacter caeni]MCU7549567.1 hypothetical protein [Paraflavisolibacter caeni]
MSKVIILFISISALLTSFYSCQKEVDGTIDGTLQPIELRFRPVANGQRLEFGSTYTNTHNESFSVRAFKFYISSIDLVNESTGATYQVDRNQYYLVNFADSNSVVLKLKAPAAQYSTLAFTIGVDSLHNVSGAQTGALDPANGMFWTWNTGYIMAKLEGYSSVSNQPNQLFEYHIGGFKGDNNVVKKAYLSFPGGASIDTEDGKESAVTISADVNKWFTGPHQISIASNPVCMTPGPLAEAVADNYLRMFSVEQVINQ